MYFTCPSISGSNGGRPNRQPLRNYLTWGMPPDASAAIAAVYRSDWGRILATLIRLVGDFDVPEEAAQQALPAPTPHGRASGVPHVPRRRPPPTAPPTAPTPT